MTDTKKTEQRALKIRAEAAGILTNPDAPNDVRVAASVADTQAGFTILAIHEGEHLAAGNALATATEALETAKRWRTFHHMWPDTKDGRHQREENSERGRKPKRRRWADELADMVGSWDEIPKSSKPLEIETLECDLILYRDGERVVCSIEGKESSLARSTFEKRYLRPSLKLRGQ